ncbi:hypothetical protein S245_004648, partial [Arachis hypogaea]
GVIIHRPENGWLGFRQTLGMQSTLWKSLYGGCISASSFLPNYMHTLMSVTWWGRWCHSSVLNDFLWTERFA